MENIKLAFLNEGKTSELVAYATKDKKMFIGISRYEPNPSFILLNKATAIKLAKELRKQISYLED